LAADPNLSQGLAKLQTSKSKLQKSLKIQASRNAVELRPIPMERGRRKREKQRGGARAKTPAGLSAARRTREASWSVERQFRFGINRGAGVWGIIFWVTRSRFHRDPQVIFFKENS